MYFKSLLVEYRFRIVTILATGKQMTERKKPKIEAARVTVIDGRRKIQRENKKEKKKWYCTERDKDIGRDNGKGRDKGKGIETKATVETTAKVKEKVKVDTKETEETTETL